jgi:hypothetical protein
MDNRENIATMAGLISLLLDKEEYTPKLAEEIAGIASNIASFALEDAYGDPAIAGGNEPLPIDTVNSAVV